MGRREWAADAESLLTRTVDPTGPSRFWRECKKQEA